MAAATFSIDRFLNIRAATAPTFSPDGRYVAFLTNITGVAQLWQVPTAGGWPTQLTFSHESVRGAWYNPTRYELIYSQDVGGNERTQLFRLQGVGGGMNHELGDGWTTTDLSQNPKAIHSFGGWSHDGQSIAFSATRTKESRFDVYVQKLGAEPKLIAEGPGGYYSVVSWSPDDRYLLVARPESNFNHDLYVIEIATGKVRHLTPHKGDIQYESPKWFADGKRIVLTSTHGGRDRSALLQIDLATGKLTPIAESEHEIEAVEVAQEGGWLAYLTNLDGRSKLTLLVELAPGAYEPPGKPIQAANALPLGVVTGLEFSPDGTKLGFALDGPKQNSDIWVWSLENDKLTQLTHSSRAGIPFSTFKEPELIKYKSFDGLEIPAWFYPPSPPRGEGPGVRGGPPPVIVYPHGGPESQTRPNFSGLFQYFTQRGYGILAPNVRGSAGYGAKFMGLDDTTKRMDSVKDMAHAVHWLRDSKRADPKRIAVYGGSYGGFMVLAGVTNYPDLFAAGIDVVGIANFVTFLENTGSYRRANREAEYGNLRDHREFLEKISPINHVDQIKCPMMIIHGANDPRVPVGEAEQIVAALKKRNVPVEYLRYEDEGHGLAKLKNRLDAYPKMVDFLDKHLK